MFPREILLVSTRFPKIYYTVFPNNVKFNVYLDVYFKQLYNVSYRQ